MGRILHLEWDILSCQVDDHSWIMLSWLWRLLGEMFEKELYNLMSSANSLAVVEWSKESVTSLMKTLNKSGPSTLPWQTPLVTWQGLDREELILTRWDRPERKEDIQKKRLPLIP